MQQRNRGKRIRRPDHRSVGDVQKNVAYYIERYRDLTPSYAMALTGQNFRATHYHLQALRDETQGKAEHYVVAKQLSLNNEFIYRAGPKLRDYAGAPYRATLLSFNGGSGSAAHDLMVSTFMASLELGMRGTEYSLFTPEEIMLSPDFAGKDPKARHQFSIMVDGVNGKAPFELVPDNVFGIEGPKGVNFFALECERTNSVESKHNTSAIGKLRGYLAISRYTDGRPLYWRKWGLTSLQVIFLKETQPKLDYLKEKCGKHLPGGSTQFLFNTFPMMKTQPPFKSPKPMPEMFTGPYQCVGLPDYSLMV